jgi:DNA-binding CsgD family transcriptional regulator
MKQATQATATAEVEHSGELPKLPLYLTIILGLACAWCYFFSGLIYNEQISSLYDPTNSASGSAIWFLLGAIGSLVVGNAAADFFESKKGALATLIYVLAAVLIVLALSLLGYLNVTGGVATLPLLPLTFFLIGTLATLTFLFWFAYLPVFDKRFVSVCVSCGALGGGVLYVFINLLGPIPRSIALSILVLVAFALVWLLQRQSPLPPHPNRSQTVKDRVFFYSTDLSLLLYGTIFGFTIGLILRSEADALVFVFCGFAIILAAIGTLFYLLRNSHKMMLGKVQRIIYPLLVIGLLPLPYVPSQIRVVFLLLLLFCFVCFDLVHIDSILCGFRLKACSLFYLNTRTRLPLIVGLLAGCLVDRAIGLIVFDNPTVFTICILVFIAILALSVVFIRIEPDRLRVEQQGLAGANLPSRIEYCQTIGAAKGLSPREIEVLELLSRGHGSKHIQSVLFISEGTVKTHTSNIYRKLDITVREELLAIFDENCEI